MFNDRIIDDPKMQEALHKIQAIFAEYDLCGGVCLVNENEWGYTYKFDGTWNATQFDPSMPLGMRITAQESVIGREQAQKLSTATVHVLGALRDFALQTGIWTKDLMDILNSTKMMKIMYTPFGGVRVPRIRGIDMREK